MNDEIYAKSFASLQGDGSKSLKWVIIITGIKE